MKILHSADLHLDSPLSGRDGWLKEELLAVPGKLAALAQQEHCDLMLLAGDLFDGPDTQESYDALRSALAAVKIPVFISPGNHDYWSWEAPWHHQWPENVHIFPGGEITFVDLSELNCRVYGAGYTAMDCPGLLEGFQAEADGKYHIGLFHSDPTQVSSPYCPITAEQVRRSGLHYLALGHIHKTGSFTAGDTLCAWSGCPMGRGFDEAGQKGVLLVTLEEKAEARFLPLDTPRFHWLETEAGEDPLARLEALLPALGSREHYRITLTGEAAPMDIPALRLALSRFPNLELVDKTMAPIPLWDTAGADSLEGAFFQILKDQLDGADGAAQARITLAAKIARQILDGREVTLP